MEARLACDERGQRVRTRTHCEESTTVSGPAATREGSQRRALTEQVRDKSATRPS